MSAQPQDPDFEARVRESFARQAAMATIGAELARVAPGEVEIRLPYREDLTQQHGFLHAGIVAAVADSACGYAALTLMPPGAGVVSVEFKVKPAGARRGGFLRGAGAGEALRPHFGRLHRRRLRAAGWGRATGGDDARDDDGAHRPPRAHRVTVR